MSVRLDWTMDAFFGIGGGTTRFVDRLTSALGIHASNVKIVSVYQGSVIVNFTIQDNGTTPIDGGIQGVQDKLSNLITMKQLDLGATILSASIGSIPVKIDGEGDSNGGGDNNDGGNNKGGDNKNPGQIIVQEQEASTNETVLIIVICVVAGVILLGSAAAYLIYKRYQKAHELEKMTVKNHPVNQSSQLHINGGAEDEVY